MPNGPLDSRSRCSPGMKTFITEGAARQNRNRMCRRRLECGSSSYRLSPSVHTANGHGAEGRKAVAAATALKALSLQRWARSPSRGNEIRDTVASRRSNCFYPLPHDWMTEVSHSPNSSVAPPGTCPDLVWRAAHAGLKRLRKNSWCCHSEPAFWAKNPCSLPLTHAPRPTEVLRGVYPERSERAQDDSFAGYFRSL